eukprot:g13142.t1
MGFMLTECLMAFYKGIAAGVWKLYESEWDTPYVTPSEEMRGTPPKSQSQSQAMPILLEPGLEDAEAGEEHQPQDQPDGAGPPLGPEVDGTEEEIPQGIGQEDKPLGRWREGQAKPPLGLLRGAVDAQAKPHCAL